MNTPAAMFTVVPALMTSLAPSATITSPVTVCVPLQVSVVVIVPLEVSLMALTAGTVIRPISNEVRSIPTNPTLFPVFLNPILIPLTLGRTSTNIILRPCRLH